MKIKDYHHTETALDAEQIARGITEVNNRLLMRPDYVSFVAFIGDEKHRMKATSIMAMAGGGVGVVLEEE
jgi:hypothetical protein